jgi:crotonobetaine/carnitine-CoA ligase
MVQFLMSQPPQDGERDHPVKTAVIAPLGDDALAFSERFGIDVYTEFNMTELSVPLFCGPNPTARGTCGKPRAGVSLRLVDQEGNDVAKGETGELLVRTDNPWAMSHGYLNDPDGTARTWKDGWFHTGDLFYRDSDNYYYFVDRAKDMIRRRGENISSFEVEEEIASHPAVLEVAAVAVEGDGGEDEVLAAIMLKPDASLTPEELIAYLEPRLAYFMIPRYLRIMDALPKTPTQKTEKHRLRTDGITEDTWDREAAGIKLKRETFSRKST